MRPYAHFAGIGSYANRSRGPPNRPVVEPSSSLTEPSSNAQPEPSSDAQPEPNAHLADHFRDVIDIFVNRFKQGYWNPNLTDDEEEIPKRRALVVGTSGSLSDLIDDAACSI